MMPYRDGCPPRIKRCRLRANGTAHGRLVIGFSYVTGRLNFIEITKHQSSRVSDVTIFTHRVLSTIYITINLQ